MQTRGRPAFSTYLFSRRSVDEDSGGAGHGRGNQEAEILTPRRIAGNDWRVWLTADRYKVEDQAEEL